MCSLKATPRSSISRPSHHFPLGTVMPVAGASQPASWAAGSPDATSSRTTTTANSAMPHARSALRELDRECRVIYVNTFSKKLAPGRMRTATRAAGCASWRYRERFFRCTPRRSRASDQFTLCGVHALRRLRSSRHMPHRLSARRADGGDRPRDFTPSCRTRSRAPSRSAPAAPMRNGMLERELVERAKRPQVCAFMRFLRTICRLCARCALNARGLAMPGMTGGNDRRGGPRTRVCGA